MPGIIGRFIATVPHRNGRDRIEISTFGPRTFVIETIKPGKFTGRIKEVTSLAKVQEYLGRNGKRQLKLKK